MFLKNKIAILIGASSGLGVAIAKALVKSDVLVYGLARNKVALSNLQESLGYLFHPIEMDITNREALLNWIQITFNEKHLPDILVNNAGIGNFGKVDEIPTEKWLEMVNTNLNGMYFITSLIVPFLKMNKQVSHIINIGSILATMGREDGTAYCATKYGVRGFSEALLKELRPFDIKVTCVHPGSIETDFFKNSGIEKHSNMLQPDAIADTIIHILKTPDNMLIDEIIMRPLHAQKPL